MIVVVQRVKQAEVSINNQTVSKIGEGYAILLGICEDDNERDVDKLAEKIATLRIMADEDGKMNLSIQEVKGEILAVSQFTLCADLTAGRRPSFIKAKKPDEAEKLYELFIKKLQAKDITVKTGKFGEYMQVEIQNDGPVTIVLDSKKL